MGAAVAIRADMKARSFRQQARRERDGRVAARLIAEAFARRGLDLDLLKRLSEHVSEAEDLKRRAEMSRLYPTAAEVEAKRLARIMAAREERFARQKAIYQSISAQVADALRDPGA